ncbi:hypothetical protein [Aquitalea magnusonii]|uniref:hypothetical protein n=1 Tax=Aquitalea magnusonii TaxID=332411 RepID=UPI000D7706DB|nr:hypothetical protein [Aquitalea magnusonii]
MLIILRRFVDLRLFLLIVPAVLGLVCFDQVLASTWGALLLIIPAVVGLSLLLRKIMFHVDMSLVAELAIASPIGAALVVLADRIFVAAIIIGTVLWLGR